MNFFNFLNSQQYPRPQSGMRRPATYSDSLMAINSMSVGRYDMEIGNKILLPQSALQ